MSTADANVLELRLEFDPPQTLGRVRVTGRDMVLGVEVRAYVGRRPPLVRRVIDDERQAEPVVEVTLGERALRVGRLELRVFDRPTLVNATSTYGRSRSRPTDAAT